MSEQLVPFAGKNDRQATGNTQEKVNGVAREASVSEEISGRQYRLSLRGNSLNPMIDAATPLLGMVMRVDGMNSQTMPEHLFAQVVTDVQAVEQLLQEQGYEPGVIVSFRYVLCTFIDETALGNGWSNKNEWIKQSLLVHFHNEAWGREGIYPAGAADPRAKTLPGSAGVSVSLFLTGFSWALQSGSAGSGRV